MYSVYYFVAMDRSWVSIGYLSTEYVEGINKFLEYAQRNMPNNNGIYLCPCVNCMNLKNKRVKEMKIDLICNGIS